MQYKVLINHFGVELSDTQFQSFISKNFKDLTSYSPVEGDYMVSKEAGIGWASQTMRRFLTKTRL